MAKNNKRKRNDKGDIDFDLGSFDWAGFRKSKSTYAFYYYDEIRKRHFPYFHLLDLNDDDIEIASLDPEFYERHLYWMPEHPPRDFFIRYNNWQLDLLVEFFKEVFEEKAFRDGYIPQNKYYRVILPKSIYTELMTCINEYKLLQIRDLIFEVICIAQKKYIDDIVFWGKPENQKLITTVEKETQKAIEIVEKLDDKKWISGEPNSAKPPELCYINFVFSDGAIKIKHNWLAREFIENFKNHYNELQYKNWKMDLECYPYRFEKNIHDQQFKYRLVKSLYNLFTLGGFFETSIKKPTPNKLMQCIAKILEFCLIPVADPDELDEIKIKKIRNWNKRNVLLPDITYADVPANKDRLAKYFPSDLRIIPDGVCRLDVINIGCFLGKRFNIDHLVPDLIHIAHSLKEGSLFRGNQITADGIHQPAPFKEFESFRKLINGIRDKKKITSVKFKMDGDDTEYELEQPLPLFLIADAINEYTENQQVEIDTDLYKNTITNLEKDSFSVTSSTKFNKPEERFMIRFVKSFYDYLLNEAPPSEQDLLPSKRYYTIIALMLQKTWFFYNMMDSEHFIIAKVKQWHNIALGK